jgi:hypothetical protein
MYIVNLSQIENYQSLLVLKQQCVQAIGNLVIDSAYLRNILTGENFIGLRCIMELINCKRAELSEQCFWTLNNFLISDRSLAQPLI